MRKESKLRPLQLAVTQGSASTRLSFLVMGAGCIRYGQYARGLLYLLAEAGFITFFKNFALNI